VAETDKNRAVFLAARRYTDAIGVETDHGVFLVAAERARHRSGRVVEGFGALQRARRVLAATAPTSAPRSFVQLRASAGMLGLSALAADVFPSATLWDPSPHARGLIAANAELNGVSDRLRIAETLPVEGSHLRWMEASELDQDPPTGGSPAVVTVCRDDLRSLGGVDAVVDRLASTGATLIGLRGAEVHRGAVDLDTARQALGRLRHRAEHLLLVPPQP
jgi:hypothetical protein